MSICIFCHYYDSHRIIVENTQYFDIFYHLDQDDVVRGVSFETKLRTTRLLKKTRNEEVDAHKTLGHIHHFFRILFRNLVGIKSAFKVWSEPIPYKHSHKGWIIGTFFNTDQYMVVKNDTEDRYRIAIYPVGTPIEVEFTEGCSLEAMRHEVYFDWRNLFYLIGCETERDKMVEVDDCPSFVLEAIDHRCFIDLSALNIKINDCILPDGRRIIGL